MDTTDERIQTALLHLMNEKPLPEITIIAVADQSGINRTTVYRHYVDKYAILQKIEDDILEDLSGLKKETYQVQTKEFVTGDGLFELLRAVNDQRDKISILMGKNGDPRFYERFIAFLTNRGLTTIESTPRFNGLDTRQKELLVQYISSALMGLIKYWLKHPEMSVEELDTFFENLFKNGINSFTEA